MMYPPGVGALEVPPPSSALQGRRDMPFCANDMFHVALSKKRVTTLLENSCDIEQFYLSGQLTVKNQCYFEMKRLSLAQFDGNFTPN